MGKRYQRILQQIQVPFKAADLEWEKTLDVTGIKRVIIATPTLTHYRYVKFFNAKGIEILCEKPIVKSVDEICSLNREIKVPFYMACNWAFVNKQTIYKPESNVIRYANKRTGDDGLEWDCIQLIYLSTDFDLTLDNKAEYFSCKINGYNVTLEDIEDSYSRMIRCWIDCPMMLWTMADAVKATCKVEGYLKRVKHNDPGAGGQYSPAK